MCRVPPCRTGGRRFFRGEQVASAYGRTGRHQPRFWVYARRPPPSSVLLPWCVPRVWSAWKYTASPHIQAHQPRLLPSCRRHSAHPWCPNVRSSLSSTRSRRFKGRSSRARLTLRSTLRQAASHAWSSSPCKHCTSRSTENCTENCQKTESRQRSMGQRRGSRVHTYMYRSIGHLCSIFYHSCFCKYN